jgi:hypothetical protein
MLFYMVRRVIYMNIIVQDHWKGSEKITLETFIRMTESFPISERVPGVEGEAFDVKEWYRQWSGHTNTPTHLKVEAADEFQASISWEELEQAAVLFAKHGEALKKGYPLRLYVPQGTSECLNVKSVVHFEFIDAPNESKEAEYGFKNEISLEQLKYSK